MSVRVCVCVCTNGGFACIYVYGEGWLMEYGVLGIIIYCV